MQNKTTSIRISTNTHRRIVDIKTQLSFNGPMLTIDDVINLALDHLVNSRPNIQDRYKDQPCPTR